MKPFLIYDFATAPISLYMREKIFYQCTMWQFKLFFTLHTYRAGSGGENGDEEGETHFLRRDFPHHGLPHPHHHHHHHHRPRLQEETELELQGGRGRRWSTGDRVVPRGGRSESPPLPFVSDSHSIIGGYDDMYSGGGGLGYQRTLRFSDKQPLQVRPKNMYSL
jgi:hypothetical protein